MKQFVADSTRKEAYAQSLEILETIGVRFDSEEIRMLFRKHGAQIDGDKVRIPRFLVEEAIRTTPKQLESRSDDRRIVAATPFSSAPFILDDDTGLLHRCTIEDAIRFYQINETSPLYECVNPGCADPQDNTAPDRFVAQIAMSLKYSNKYPSIGLRATRSTALDGDVYGSARKAFRLVREFYDIWDQPVMTQGICPDSPLAYDRECIDNLCAAIDEKQPISLSPCSVGFMTAPESIMGVVIHDFALALAGLVLIQLKSPGHETSLSEFSTIGQIRTLQPNYGSVESVYLQVIFYELCKSLGLPCSISGGYGDGTRVDYQAGMEASLTAMLPFHLTEVQEVWCYPGIMAGFACGSFQKIILDEETMRVTNRMLQGAVMTIDQNLPEKLSAGMNAGNFLGIGRMKTYHRDNYMTNVFNKWGIGQAENPEKSDLAIIAQKIIEERIASYELPERTATQKKILQAQLPLQCLY
jgi:trimethylamine---corrinoid protein Co-methyltransferase